MQLAHSAATFIFAECVLSYIEGKYTDALLAKIVSLFDLTYVANYEMFNPSDGFGRMMIKNFEVVVTRSNRSICLTSLSEKVVRWWVFRRIPH